MFPGRCAYFRAEQTSTSVLRVQPQYALVALSRAGAALVIEQDSSRKCPVRIGQSKGPAYGGDIRIGKNDPERNATYEASSGRTGSADPGNMPIVGCFMQERFSGIHVARDENRQICHSGGMGIKRWQSMRIKLDTQCFEAEAVDIGLTAKADENAINRGLFASGAHTDMAAIRF